MNGPFDIGVRGFVAQGLSPGRPLDGVPEPPLFLWGMRPPRALPEGLPGHLRDCCPNEIKRGLIDLQQDSLRREKPDESVGEVEDGPRLPLALTHRRLGLLALLQLLRKLTQVVSQVLVLFLDLLQHAVQGSCEGIEFTRFLPLCPEAEVLLLGTGLSQPCQVQDRTSQDMLKPQ